MPKMVLECAAHPDLGLNLALTGQLTLALALIGTSRKNVIFRVNPAEMIGKLGLTSEQCGFASSLKRKRAFDACLTSNDKTWNSPPEV